MPETDWRARCRKLRADNKQLKDTLEFTERALDLARDEASRLRERVAELAPQVETPSVGGQLGTWYPLRAHLTEAPPSDGPPRRWWQVGLWK